MKFDIATGNNSKRENAYKAILVISLSFTICSWACMTTVIPFVYHLMTITNDQFNNILEYCEDTAQTAAQETKILIENNLKQSVKEKRTINQFNLTNNLLRFQRQVIFPLSNNFLNTHNCKCEAAPGQKGLPGRPGLKGVKGAPGAPGKPARLPCQPLIDFKKYCPEQCPRGNQGQPGLRGLSGDKGLKGIVGNKGKDGEDGKKGLRGYSGIPGLNGIDGDDGDVGIDAIPSPFVPGPPGPVGEIGPIGPIGPRGMPGIDGPSGSIGMRGDSGLNGLPGQQGQPGLAGFVGDPGSDGHPGVCPTYCASDGGVFFVEPPEWFFKEH